MERPQGHKTDSREDVENHAEKTDKKVKVMPVIAMKAEETYSDMELKRISVERRFRKSKKRLDRTGSYSYVLILQALAI